MFFNKSHILLAVHVFGLVKKAVSMSPWKAQGIASEAFPSGRGYSLSQKASAYSHGKGEMSDSTPPVLSPVTQHIFKRLEGVDPHAHVEKSMVRFQTAAKNIIDESIKNDRLVYIEDSETDDHWQSGITALGGIVPAYVFHRGGHEFVRGKVEENVWDTFEEKFVIKHPIIKPIHATRPGEEYAHFDDIEGHAILDPAEIKRLREASQADSDESYQHRIQSAKNDLLNFLKAGGPATIALKTAPSGLAEIISQVPDYENKIAIVWTAAVAMWNPVGFQPKFNFDQDLKAGHALLNLKVPIFLASPKLSNSRLVAIVDKAHMDFFNKKAKLKSRFEGFDGLSKVVAKEGLVMSSLFHGTQTHFMESMANSVKEAMPRWKKQEENLKSSIPQAVAVHGSDSDMVKKMEEQLLDVQVQLLGAERGLRSKDSEHTGLENYQEYCVVDHFVEPVLNAIMREAAVLEVIEVELKADERVGNKLLNATPLEGGNVFILSHIDSTLLEKKIQQFIDWMLAGEPVLGGGTTARRNG